MKVLHVVGARPNFMKVAPIMREMAKHPQEFEQLLVHTGQHYGNGTLLHNMSKVFFEKAERLLGWRPRVSFTYGVQQLVVWYQANDEWARNISTD